MIRKVHLQNVAGIAEFANQESFPGVTVILGKNDVCKTSLLKMLYVLEKSSELYSRKAVHESGISASGVTAEKMRGVYGRNKVDLGDIVRKTVPLNGFMLMLSSRIAHGRVLISHSVLTVKGR